MRDLVDLPVRVPVYIVVVVVVENLAVPVSLRIQHHVPLVLIYHLEWVHPGADQVWVSAREILGWGRLGLVLGEICREIRH
jgi:hypothetical protein